ncbi:hypothetical protein ACVF5U_003078 [Escherichia coli]
MLGGADNPNGELPSYITGADIKEGTNSVELGYTRNYTHTIGLMWGESG